MNKSIEGEKRAVSLSLKGLMTAFFQSPPFHPRRVADMSFGGMVRYKNGETEELLRDQEFPPPGEKVIVFTQGISQK